MAANIMEILKQIQRDLSDQKQYMRNLHVINRNLNEKFILMEEKINNLDKNNDQQQILMTIERLEQEVKKNNMVLFGNDETHINLEEKTTMSYEPDEMEKPGSFKSNSKTTIEIAELNEFKNTEVVQMEEINLNYDDTGKNIDHFRNELKEMKQLVKDFVAIKQTPIDKSCKQNSGKMVTTFINADHINRLDDKLQQISDVHASDMENLRKSIKNFEEMIKPCVVKAQNTARQQDTAQTFSTYFSIEQINQLNAEIKRVTGMNQSETEDIKDLIKNLVATSKIPIKESVSTIREGTIQIPSTYFTTEHFNEFNVKLMREIEEIKKLINEFIATSKVWNEDAKEISTTEETGLAFSICSELKRIARTNQSDVKEFKELIKDVATKLLVNVEEAVSGVSKQKTVQISPTYFSPDQISKLNSELKRVAEIYQGTGMFPVIEVVPGAADEHPVMKQLRQGVCYKPRDSCDQDQIVKLKLGLGGFKRFDVIDMITEYPDLTLVEVIREWWSPRKDRSRTWQEAYKLYNFSAPLTRDKDGNLVPLESFK